MEWVAGVEIFIESVVTGFWAMAGFGLGWTCCVRRGDVTAVPARGPQLCERFTEVPRADRRGESRQVRSEASERGPLDALSGADRVVRRLSKHYAVSVEKPWWSASVVGQSPS
jgi:hypothetical protein